MISRKTALRIRIAYVLAVVVLSVVFIHLLHITAEVALGEANPITQALDRIDVFEYIVSSDIEFRRWWPPMRRRKAVFYFVASLVAFFLAGVITGYVTRWLIERLPIDSSSGVGSAITSGLASVVGFLYRKLALGLLKKSVKALFKRRLFSSGRLLFMGSRKRKRKYLGSRVPDTGKPGLDSLAEVRGIVREIRRDFKKGRISKTLAVRRLALLKLAVSRDRDFQDPKKQKSALKTIDRYLDRVRNTKVR